MRSRTRVGAGCLSDDEVTVSSRSSSSARRNWVRGAALTSAALFLSVFVAPWSYAGTVAASSANLAPLSSSWVTDSLPVATGSEQRAIAACSSASDCWVLVDYTNGTAKMFATTTGGASWTTESVPDPAHLYSISCARDTLDCWAAGGTQSRGFVDQTTNGNPVWSYAQLDSSSFSGISCADTQHCLVVGADGYQTADGGHTWSLSQSLPALTNSTFGYYSGVSCASAAVCTVIGAGAGIASAPGLAYTTTDGGRTWSLFTDPDLGIGAFTSISCADTNDCVIVGFPYGPETELIIATRDGGKTWQTEAAPRNPGGSEAPLLGVSCASPTICWGVEVPRTSPEVPPLFETMDGGATWRTVQPTINPTSASSSPLSPQSISCATATMCLATGGKGFSYGLSGNGLPLVMTTRDAPGAGCAGSLPTNSAVGIAPDADGGGYWLASSSGGVVACGSAVGYGSLQAEHRTPSAPIVAIARAANGNGYYLLARDGTVYPFGPGARTLGSAPAHSGPFVGLAVDEVTGGYWVAASNGGVFSFGAPFRGSLPGIGSHVDDITGIAGGSAAQGYWMVASNGGVFSFGVPFYGSLPGLGVHVHDVVAMKPAANTPGYYLVGADGGVFALGSHLRFCGSAVGSASTPVVAASVDTFDGTYWLLDHSGQLFGLDAPIDGNAWSSGERLTSC